VNSRNNGDPRVAEALHLIQHEPSGVSVNRLAARFQLSPSRFAHLFKLNVHCSVMSYVNRGRIADAARLLTDSELSIKEIAFQTGFGSSSTFSRRFRRGTGMSPREYRLQQQLTNQNPCTGVASSRNGYFQERYLSY
jgi:AraC-like DNA-binding protein